MPQNTISSVNTYICAVNAGIQESMSVGIEPAANAVMTVGELHAGFAGSGNIIPDSAYLAGTIRTFDEGVREKIKSFSDSDGRQHRNSTRCTCESYLLPQRTDCLERPADPRLCFPVRSKSVGRTGNPRFRAGAGRQVCPDQRFGGLCLHLAEDSSAALSLVAGTPAEGYTAPGHNPKTNFNEDVLYIGSACYAAVINGSVKRKSLRF